MERRKGNSLAIVLIGLGAFILLSKIGIFAGDWFSYLLPILLVALGYYGVRAGNKFFGWMFIIIGGISLLSKFSWLIVILIAIGMIIYGFSILKGNRNHQSY
ncbi:LiaF transmembrane domain-containing protein [Paenibacillus sp. 481]|uniref:LiaF transmembrane domain-containing protein n=1 Tax=Paenibacillus sp. 481 TaxID=2835869 RepID=UPI001E3AF88D|nr:hypothetical protein [Paenibacillus sp. 481]UHA71836.1 hypothetical protein KIK04_13915 [Paenibacillus sp. 481]